MTSGDRTSSAPSASVTPSILFGAGEMADHVIRLMQWIGMPTDQLRLFDDGYPAKSHGPCGLPVVGRIANGLTLCGHTREPAIIAIGSKCTAFRWGLYQRLKEAGVPLASVIHPGLVCAPGVRIGENAIIFSGGTLAKGVQVGALCTLWSGVLLEHDTAVGDNVTLGPAAKTSGHVSIGRHAFLGIGATVAPSVRIGERALIGAGAVVIRDVEAGAVMAGVPARMLHAVRPGMDAPTAEDLERFAQLPLPRPEAATAFDVAGGQSI